jgi:hypothetical protein
MSVGPTGGAAASAAGSQLAQTKGTDVERAQQTANVKARQNKAAETAASAAGIGETDTDDDRANDRDADGRRLFEVTENAEQPVEPEAEETPSEAPQSRDPTGNRGGKIDLSG